LRSLRIPLLLIACENDRAVAPQVAEDVTSRVKSARTVRIGGLGHLAHEEAPMQFARLIAESAAC
jgi:magnesium chelatase accessory protein